MDQVWTGCELGVAGWTGVWGLQARSGWHALQTTGDGACMNHACMLCCMHACFHAKLLPRLAHHPPPSFNLSPLHSLPIAPGTCPLPVQVVGMIQYGRVTPLQRLSLENIIIAKVPYSYLYIY